MSVMIRRLLLSLPILLLASCSHPLAGNWSQELPGGAQGMSIEFDGKGDKVLVHTAPRPDGSPHEHVNGTYVWDSATKTLTVKAKLMGDGKADTWSGRLVGDDIELSSADGKLTFHHGGDAHAH